MKVTYGGKSANDGGKAASAELYEIESDRHGNYTIRLGGKVVKRVTSLTNYVGRPKWGSRKLEVGAIEEAKGIIDIGMAEASMPAARVATSSPFLGTAGASAKHGA
jgi:hypothetical protein